MPRTLSVRAPQGPWWALSLALWLLASPSLLQFSQAAARPSARLTAQAVPPQEPAPRSSVGPTDTIMPLSLTEAIRLALQNSLDIERSRVAPEVARAQLEQTRAVFDPSVSLTASFGQAKALPVTQTLIFDSDTGAITGARVVRPFSDHAELTPGLQQKIVTGANYSISLMNTRDRVTPLNNRIANPRYSSDVVLTFIQPLLKDFGLTVNLAPIQQALQAEESARQQVLQTILDTIFAVQQGYWTLVFRIQDLAAKRESHQLAIDFLAENTQRVELGIVARIDLVQARTQVKVREGEVIAAETAWQEAEDSLKLLLNLPERAGTWQFSLVPSDPLPFVPVQDLGVAEKIELALHNRPDVLQAQLAVASQAIAYEVAQHQQRPRLDLQGQASVSAFSDRVDAALANLGQADGYRWAIGMQLTYPLGNRTARSEVQKQGALLRQAQVEQRQVRQTVEQQIRQAVRSLESFSKRVDATRAASMLARTQLEAEQEKFRLGLSTSFNVLTFQSQLSSARSEEANALSAYNIALGKLDQVMGILQPEAR
ncbi:MAG: TolC family protein [Candidatus Tectimicrobiota bacterium]